MKNREMIDSNKLGTMIAQYRTALGMTKYRLAQKALVSHPTIVQVEAGKRRLGWDTAVQILDALGYEVEIVKKGERK